MERAALVALLRRPDVTPSQVRREIATHGTASAALRHVLRDTGGGLPRDTEERLPRDTAISEMVTAASAEITRWQAAGIRVLAFFDPDYPSLLLAGREPPPLLFTRGRLRPDERSVAVVGRRQASESGLRIARIVATSLSRRGITVVGGLGLGVDTSAHTAALAAGGRTVAVVGAGVGQHLGANRHLQERIAHEGLVASPFWPDTPSGRENGATRDAVLAGYAAMTVVVEAGPQSAARSQARLALGHRRPVVLTSQVMRHVWAHDLARAPGVHVAGDIAETLTLVDNLLGPPPSTGGPDPSPRTSGQLPVGAGARPLARRARMRRDHQS